MRLLELFTDGGSQTGDTRHYECRDCGANLSVEVDECPECGGEIAVYVF